MNTFFPETESICDCYSCGAPMTCADVDDIPPEEFHEDCPECEDCRAKKTKKTEEEAEADKEAYRVREEARFMKMLGETEGKAYAAKIWAKMWSEEEDEECDITEDTIVAGIVCRACSHTLPPMTVKQHLSGDFNKTCPHTA